MFRYLSTGTLKATPLHLQPCVVVLTWIFLHLYGDDLNSCISETKEWILPKYHRERMNQIPRRECVWPLVPVVMLYCHRPCSCHRSRGMNLPPTCFCKRGDGSRNPHLLQWVNPNLQCFHYYHKSVSRPVLKMKWSLGFQPPKKRGSSAIFVMREFWVFKLRLFFFIIMRYCWYLHELEVLIEHRLFRNINHGALNG